MNSFYREGDNTALLTKCLNFCKLIGSKGTYFHLSVTIGRDFTFSMKHGKLDKISKSTATENTTTKKKYVSPSTRMRNQRRLQSFWKRKWGETTHSPKHSHPSLDTGPKTTPGTESNIPSIQLSPNTENIVTYNPKSFSWNPPEASMEHLDRMEQAQLTEKGTQKDTLNRRLDSHFTCDICDISFTRSKNLNKHNIKHHQDVTSTLLPSKTTDTPRFQKLAKSDDSIYSEDTVSTPSLLEAPHTIPSQTETLESNPPPNIAEEQLAQILETITKINEDNAQKIYDRRFETNIQNHTTHMEQRTQELKTDITQTTQK